MTMKTVTSAQMKAIDRKAIEAYGIPSLLLMENAGRGIAEMICPMKPAPGNVVVACGKGNNGGDGLVIARHLSNRGFAVKVFLFAEPESLKDDPAVNFRIIAKMGIAYSIISDDNSWGTFLSGLQNSDMIIDAIFGVGLEREVTGILRRAIDAINQMVPKKIVAVDIPSGLNADTGEVLGAAVKASVTATLCLPKQCLFCGRGPEYAGRIAVIDIGIPPAAVQEILTGKGIH